MIKYKDWLIYWLYNRESDLVIISESINFNEDLLTDENIKNNEITNQSSISETEFFIKLFTESLNEFFNKEIFVLSDLMPESVRNKAKVKKNIMKISSSWEEISIMRHERSKKKTVLVNKVILSVKILE